MINKTEKSPYLTELFERKVKHSNCKNLVTHTKAHRDNIYAKNTNLNLKNSVLFHHPLEYSDDLELNYSSEGDQKNVLFVGRFEERKGIDILLDLISKVILQEPKTFFRLVGPDTNKYYQSKFQNEHPKLSNNVFFLERKEAFS